MTHSAPEPKDKTAIRIWDAPTRLFHWALAGLVVALFISGNIGGTAMDVHMLAGYGVLTLVLFRLGWGIIGSTTSRFSSFVKGPSAGLAYLTQARQGAPSPLGHNPVGGWMVLALLAVLLVQAGMGLFANDDILTEGPLAHLVSSSTSGMLTGWHKILAKVLMALVVLHVGAALLYLVVKKENLIRPMVTGTKPVEALPPEAAGLSFTGLGRAAILLAISAGIVWAVVTLP